MEEEWRFIPWTNGNYSVSSHGMVMSHARTIIRNKYGPISFPSIILKHGKSMGYPMVRLCVNKMTKNHLIHRLVAEMFIPNPERLPMVNHIDGNKENNQVSNLEWCTSQRNIQHSWELGLSIGRRGEKNPSAKLSDLNRREIISLWRHGASQSEIAEKFKIHQATVSKVIKKGIAYLENIQDNILLRKAQ